METSRYDFLNFSLVLRRERPEENAGLTGRFQDCSILVPLRRSFFSLALFVIIILLKAGSRRDTHIRAYTRMRGVQGD